MANMTTSRIVINSQTCTEDERRIVALARLEAQKRKAFLRRLRIVMYAMLVIIALAMVSGAAALAVTVWVGR
jgi:hypothetical protein